jgi:hypothetical protein
MCNTDCFSTATIVARTRLNVTSHVHTLPVLRRIHTYHAVPLPRPCHYPATTLPFSESALFHNGHCIWDWYASDNKLPGTRSGKSPTCRQHAANMPSPCRRDPATNVLWTYPGLERSLSERHIRGMAGERHGNGMACANQTRPHCVNQMGHTQSKALVERHVRGTAGEWHGNGTVCVNRPLKYSNCRRFRKYTDYSPVLFGPTVCEFWGLK